MTSRNNRVSMWGRYRSHLIAVAVLCGATSHAATSVGYIRNGLVAHWDGVENADFGGTVCGLHIDGEPSRLGKPTIPYGCNLLEDGTVFELAEPNLAKDNGQRMVVKSIASYSFNGTTGQWEFAARTAGPNVSATYSGEPVKYVLEWKTQDSRLIIYVR